MSLLESTEKMRRDRTLIEALIEEPSRLGPDFQPIRDLTGGELVGHKATGRGQRGTDLDDTVALLAGAQSTGLVERLDWAFRCLALDAAVDAGLPGELHLTPEPETYGSPCPPRLVTAFGRGRRELAVAAEVHPAGLLHPRLSAAAAEWRAWGWRVVLADVGDASDFAPGDLVRRLDRLRPDVVQVDVRDPGHRAVPQVREVLTWAENHGAQVHAVGVDSEARRTQAVDLGAVAGRGLLLGLPAALS
jgi:EAL domain-containing protein (putative c-di-GMP-specific phosphodiesterase class I)